MAFEHFMIRILNRVSSFDKTTIFGGVKIGLLINNPNRINVDFKYLHIFFYSKLYT